MQWCDANYTKRDVNDFIYQTIVNNVDEYYEDMPRDYNNPKALWDWCVENIEDFEDLIYGRSYEEIVNRYDNKFSKLDYDTQQEIGLEDIALKELQSTYQEGCQEVYDYLGGLLDDLEERLKDCNIRYEQKVTHSWCPGNFPSEYFTFSIENEDTDLNSESEIRVCDGHDNRRDNPYQINLMDCIDVNGNSFVLDKGHLHYLAKYALYNSFDEIDEVEFTDEEEKAWNAWLKS